MKTILPLFLTALLTIGCKEKSAEIPEAGKSSAPVLEMPVIDIPEATYAVDTEITLHVIVTSSDNPFTLDPAAKVVTTTFRAIKAPFGEGGSFSEKTIADAVKSLDLPGLKEVRIHSISEKGPADPMANGSAGVNLDEEGDTSHFGTYASADTDGKIHSFVVAQIEKP